MSIFDFLFSFHRRAKSAGASNDARTKNLEKVIKVSPKAVAGANDAANAQMLKADTHKPEPRSVLPRAPGAPARANFGTLKPRPFGRAPTRR